MRLFICFIFISLSSNIFSQGKKDDVLIPISFTAGLTFNQAQNIEAGIFLAKANSDDCHLPGTKGLRITNKFLLASNNFYIAPTLGYEVTYGLLGGRCSFSNFTNFKQNDFRLIPELGLNFYYVTILYGYNVSLSKSQFNFVNPTFLSLFFNFYNKKSDL